MHPLGHALCSSTLPLQLLSRPSQISALEMQTSGFASAGAAASASRAPPSMSTTSEPVSLPTSIAMSLATSATEASLLDVSMSASCGPPSIG
jgi:hypothetical protein